MNELQNKMFVYGTLRCHFHHKAHLIIRTWFQLLGNATTPGLLYDLGSFPGAVPAANGNLIVGELYQLTDTNNHSIAFDQLDHYEGVIPEAREEQLYRREMTDVFFQQHNVSAWIYWYNLDVTHGTLIPGGDYLLHQQL